MRFRARTRLARLERLVDPMILVVPPGFWIGGLDGWDGVRFFRCKDILGLIRTWGWLSRPVGPGFGFWGLGLGLVVIMLESRHRKWQGASVSDLGVVGVWCDRPLALDGAQDERTGGWGLGWSLAEGCLVRPSVGGAYHERTGCRQGWGVCWAGILDPSLRSG